MLNRIKNSFYGLKVRTFFKLLPDNEVVILKTTFNNSIMPALNIYLNDSILQTLHTSYFLFFSFNREIFTFKELLDTLETLHIEINDN